MNDPSFNSLSMQQLDMANLQRELTLSEQRKEVGERDESLEKAAHEFEAIFMRMMLKSMRQAQDVLADENNPLNSYQAKFYRDMHDQELANGLAKNGGMGLAEIIVQQLGGQNEGFTPASVIRQDANLPNQTGMQKPAASKRAVFDTPDEFVEALSPIVEKAAQSLGVDGKAVLAQAALETGWGQHLMHNSAGRNSHNLFGIKSSKNWSGDTVSVPTLEYKDGVAKQEVASFRAYGSFEESIHDYIQYIQDTRLSHSSNSEYSPKAFFNLIASTGYATDPKYADKLNSIYARLNQNTSYDGVGQ